MFFPNVQDFKYERKYKNHNFSVTGNNVFFNVSLITTVKQNKLNGLLILSVKN